MCIEIIEDTPLIVHATGEIDLSNVAEFNKALDEAAERSPKGFVIDLSDAVYIDSAGVQAILAVYLKVAAVKGHLAIVLGNSIIRSVLEVVHLEMLPGVCVHDNLDSAKHALLISEQESKQ